MDCPRCKKPAKEIYQQGVMVDFCPECKGVWMDGGEINYFVGNPGLVAEKLKEPLLGEQASELNCPRCAVPMRKGGLIESSLEVDHCATCNGLWFNPGEAVGLGPGFGQAQAVARAAVPRSRHGVSEGNDMCECLNENLIPNGQFQIPHP